MSDLFDIANLITTVGVDGVKIKPEPGLPEKSSNEILTELFSTFDGLGDDEDNDDDDDDEEADQSSSSGNNKTTTDEKKDKKKESIDGVKVKLEKKDDDDDKSEGKKKKKKHKHKSENKDVEKKHKHKKKSRHRSSDSPGDPDDPESKKKKKKKKSKRKHDSESKDSENEEPSSKVRKLKDIGKKKSENDSDSKEKIKSKSSETIKIKKEKVDSPKKKDINVLDNKEKTPDLLPPVSKRLDDDAESIEVPKFIEKSKNPPVCKILIKDLKNSKVYNNTVREVENMKKEIKENMEDGEISDSDEDTRSNRTPTLSPTPPPDHTSTSGMRSDRKKHSRSSSSSNKVTKKNDLRLVLKEKEKKKQLEKSNSKSDREKITKSNEKTSRSNSCHSRDRRTRSRSADRNKRRGRSRERFNNNKRNEDKRSRKTDKYNSHSEDRNKNRWRGRSRSTERKDRIEIDKKKLLEIAKRNAINMVMKGKLPIAQQDKAIAAINNGGKTINELTDFCKKLSRSEAMGELSSVSSGDESESEKGFHHPFILKDRPNSIIMNIKDSKQLPTKTHLEKTTTDAQSQLRIQYPVSSGQQHRKNAESEWIPVPPKPKNKNSKTEPKKLFVPAKEVLSNIPLPLVVPSLQTQQLLHNQAILQPNMAPPMLPMQPNHPMYPAAAIQPVPPVSTLASSTPVRTPEEALSQPPPPGVTDYEFSNTGVPIQPAPMPVPPMPLENQSVFPPPQSVDISNIVSQRLSAMRKLSENPHDVQACNEMYNAQSGMQTWVESKQAPGQFTGSTGANVLSQAELNSGYQTWSKKDQFTSSQPISGGMGMALLQKMGWKPGEGLGKNKEGTLEPLQLEIKLDKKGLVSDEDVNAHKFGKVAKSHVPTIKSLEGKHPVSVLGEFCSKHKYGAPTYELCLECGPDHKKNFLFKVKVNGTEYKPSVASPNKKLAKAEAAQVCLQAMGILPP